MPQQENHGPLWTIETRPFGYPMFPTEAWSFQGNVGWSDRIDEAMQFDGRDSKKTKLAFYAMLVKRIFGDAVTVTAIPLQ